MKGNYPHCLAKVLVHEGGWADHPKDPGGATMKGVTIGTFRAFKDRDVTKAELRAISDADIATIYKQGYWDKVSGDLLPSGVDYVAFDPAVNSGPSRGAKWLQKAAGVAQDGKIGKGTLAAVRASDPVALIKQACAIRMGFLKGLKTWGTFGKGWSRRVAGVEAEAIVLAAGRSAAVEEIVPAKKAVARDQAATVAPAAGGAGSFQIEGLPDWSIGLAAVVAVVLIVILLGQVRHNNNRVKALTAAATGV